MGSTVAIGKAIREEEDMTDDDKAIVQTKTFEERLKDRIRESIGELMSDEDLQKIIERGIDDVFFKTHHEPHGPYNTREKPPLIHAVVKEVLDKQMKEAVAAWLQTHEAEVQEAVGRCVQEGAGTAVIKALNWQMENAMDRLRADIFSKIQNI